LNAINIFCHNCLSSGELLAVRNILDKYWHLFSSDSSFVQTSVEEVTHNIGGSTGDDDWQEYTNRLRSFQSDNNNRVSHPGVSCKHGTHCKNYKCDSILIFLVSVHQTNFDAEMSVKISKGTSDNHSWKEKTTW